MIQVDYRLTRQITTAGTLTERLGQRRPTVIQHYLQEIHAIDGHKIRTIGDGGSPTTNRDSSVERALEQLESLDTDMAAIQAAEQLLIDTLADIDHRYNKMLGTRLSVPRLDPDDHGTRCKAHGCDQWAAEHILPLTGSKTPPIWCDDHWPAACQVCGDHPHDGRRVEGVHSCENAYRRWLRSSKDPAA